MLSHSPLGFKEPSGLALYFKCVRDTVKRIEMKWQAIEAARRFLNRPLLPFGPYSPSIYRSVNLAGDLSFVNKYEALLIFKSSFETEGMDAALTKVEDTLKNNGANLLRTDKVGRKKMAYEIQKVREGFIAVIGFEAPGAAIDPITKVLNINEELIRCIITRNDALDVNKPFIVTPVTGREPREMRGGPRGGGGRGGRPGQGGGRRPRGEGEEGSAPSMHEEANA
jgi:small subunit ribosomal protein S6